MKNVCRKGLLAYVNTNVHAQTCIRQFAALPLLPSNRIEEGYQSIRNYARNQQLEIMSFFNYFSK